MNVQLVSVAPAVQPVALTREDAARALGVGLTYFETNVQPHLGLVRCGRKRLVPVTELERWVREHTEAPVAEQVKARR